MRKRAAAVIAAVGMAAGFGAAVQGATIQSGDLVVLRVGDGTQTLGNTGNTEFLDEYSTAGANQNNSIQIPDSGGTALIASGSATSEGAISLNKNGTAITVSGYNTSRPAGSSLTSSTAAVVARGAGSVAVSTGNYTFTNSYGSQFSANNVRSSVSDGTNTYGLGANSGVVLADGSGTVVSSTSTNNRVANIFNNTLYFSTGSGTAGIYSLPLSTATSQTATLLFATGAGSSPYDFEINAAGTLAYVADDRAAASGGGIQKWALSAGVWSLQYTFTTTDAVRGLAVNFATNTLYASSGGGLWSITDGGGTAAMNEIALAPSGTAFRGLVLAPLAAPVPEPASLGVLALGGLLLVKRRSR